MVDPQSGQVSLEPAIAETGCRAGAAVDLEKLSAATGTIPRARRFRAAPSAFSERISARLIRRPSVAPSPVTSDGIVTHRSAKADLTWEAPSPLWRTCLALLRSR